jgi:predicted nucleotide-binding protein (sugar kinase/HSP70/actin superfamily)
LTNFNCGPDSFLLSYAEQVMGDRPFLALELDEHGADAGYMTRIEAFFDVLRRQRTIPAVARRPATAKVDLRDHTVWIPPMHSLAAPIFAACFRSEGIDGRPLPPEDREAFEMGRSVTRGSECLPTALTLGAFLQAIERTGGSKHTLFMPTAEGPCRFGQYCTLHQQVLDRLGLKEANILAPSSFNSYQGLPERLRRKVGLALVVGDVLFKAVLKVRPYELHPGETNRVTAQEVSRVESVFERNGDIMAAVRQAVQRISAVPHGGAKKPLVGIVGEIYVRCNTFANEDVVGAIERFGGEAWLAPMFEWILYTLATQKISFRDRSRNPVAKWIANLKNIYVFGMEHRTYDAAGPFLADRHEPPIEEVVEAGRRFIPVNFEGETLVTVGRTIKFAEQGAAMVVNCAPFGCMPGTITTAIFRRLAPQLGIPVLGMFYDGHGNQNQRLEVFLNNAVTREQPSVPRQPFEIDRPVPAARA